MNQKKFGGAEALVRVGIVPPSPVVTGPAARSGRSDHDTSWYEVHHGNHSNARIRDYDFMHEDTWQETDSPDVRSAERSGRISTEVVYIMRKRSTL